MRFTAVLGTMTALIGLVSAAKNAFRMPPSGEFELHSGEPTQFDWDSNGGGDTITLTLYPKDNEKDIQTLLGHEKNTGQFTWTPNDKIHKGEYTIKIENENGDKNYGKVKSEVKSS